MYLRREWRSRGEEIHIAAAQALLALARLPAASEPLPLFANRVLRDPHALDSDELAGRLWYRALSWAFPEIATATASPAEERSALLAAVGLAIDDVSSQVLIAGAFFGNSLLDSSRELGLAVSLPLRTIMELDGASAWRHRVYVIENPAVFSILLDTMHHLLPQQRPALICTAGHLSLAARRLLDKLAIASEIFYSGDFDLGGLAIAAGLISKYGSAVTLWRMDPESYLQAGAFSTRSLNVNGRGIEKLKKHFPELVSLLLSKGPAYQESLGQLLINDVIEFAGVQLAAPMSP
jgi:uncharacterized protein (TIGR02679 family)